MSAQATWPSGQSWAHLRLGDVQNQQGIPCAVSLVIVAGVPLL